MPDPALTPGAVLTTNAARVCVRGYSASVRDVPQSEKDAVYARYGVADVPYKHEVDHLVSLEVGGSNAIRNLWPEPYAGRWGARTKDVLEDRLHELVCDGRLGLRRAQRIEAADWVLAYRRYVGGTPTAPAGAGSGASGGSLGGRLLRVLIPDGEHDLLRRRPRVAQPLGHVSGAFPDVRAGAGAVPGLPPAPVLLRAGLGRALPRRTDQKGCRGLLGSA